MYIALTGSENNKDVYIYHSFRKENGKSSSRIYKKLGKYNTLLEQFDGDRDKMMAWAREQADKETKQSNSKCRNKSCCCHKSVLNKLWNRFKNSVHNWCS